MLVFVVIQFYGQLPRQFKSGDKAVDGGHDYLRRCGNREDWEELSKAEKVEDNDALT